MGGEHGVGGGVALVGGAVIVGLEDAGGVEVGAAGGKIVVLALGAGHARGHGVHGHNEKAALRIVDQVVLLGVVCQPVTVGLSDDVGVDAHPGGQLLAVAVLEGVVSGHDGQVGLIALVDDGLGHGLIGDTGHDALGLVGNGVVDGFQVLLRAHLGVHKDELVAPGFHGGLGSRALVDEPGLVAGLVDAVNHALLGAVAALGGSGSGGVGSLGLGGLALSGGVGGTGGQAEQHERGQ